jgi:hypothetical protein
MRLPEMTPSRRSRTENEATIVASVEPAMQVRTSSSFTTSPPRAGVNAFSAEPAAYEAATETTGTGRSVYAAASTFRQTRERRTRQPSWRTSAGRRNLPSSAST